MKKLILAITIITGASVVAYSQGTVVVGNLQNNGFVIVDPAGHLSSSTASYVQAPNFTVQLWALPGNVTTVSGVAGLDQYGYLNIGNLTSDGFVQVANVGNTHGGSAAGTFNGAFNNSTGAVIPGSVGGYTGSSSNPTYNQFDVLALVAWTGTFANLAAAQAGSASIGIIAFVNPLGPGGADPTTPNLTGWDNLLNSPASAANGDSQDFILAPVPEPATLTLAGLGGLASLVMLRRKKA
jgi:hypothetical protein